jgi:hypothetical protein
MDNLENCFRLLIGITIGIFGHSCVEQCWALFSKFVAPFTMPLRGKQLWKPAPVPNGLPLEAFVWVIRFTNEVVLEHCNAVLFYVFSGCKWLKLWRFLIFISFLVFTHLKSM